MKFIKYIVAFILFVCVAHSAMASFSTNKDDDAKNKYSLKHLNKLTNNYLSFQQKFKSTQTAGSFFYTHEPNGLNMSSPVNTYLFSQKTTTTFIYPYKYTAKVPKFKAPTRPND